MSKLFFDILQNSKLRYMQNKEIYLFELEFTENASAGNWTSRSVENFKTIVLPKNFEELQNVPLDKPYNFLMSLDTSSIDKKISILGIEALMFWELPKVDLALSNMCRKWFFNECKAYKKNYLDLTKPESDNEGESVEIANAGITPKNILLILQRIQKTLSLASLKNFWSYGSFVKEFMRLKQKFQSKAHYPDTSIELERQS